MNVYALVFVSLADVNDDNIVEIVHNVLRQREELLKIRELLRKHSVVYKAFNDAVSKGQ